MLTVFLTVPQSLLNSVNGADSSFTTILNMVLVMNSTDTIISRQEIQCTNEFTVQTYGDLASGLAVSGQIQSNSATLKLLNKGQCHNLWVM